MRRGIAFFLETLLSIVRAGLYGILVLSLAGSVCFVLYRLMADGQLPGLSLAKLSPRLYEYLLHDSHIAINTLYIFFIELPLTLSLALLLVVALFLDRLLCTLGQALFAAFQGDQTS
jgi:hypothetical protein